MTTSIASSGCSRFQRISRGPFTKAIIATVIGAATNHGMRPPLLPRTQPAGIHIVIGTAIFARSPSLGTIQVSPVVSAIFSYGAFSQPTSSA